VYTSLSLYTTPFKNFSGPFRRAKEIHKETHPSENKEANLLGKMMTSGRKVRDMRISRRPMEKKSANCFQEVAAC
jgi:hypothetical protein